MLTNKGLLSIFLCPLLSLASLPLFAGTTIHGSVSPMVSKASSDSELAGSTKLNDLRVYYTPTAVQLRALKQLVADQRTPGSANYHKWITPEQFGKQFGMSTADEARVKSWLKSQGFSNVSLTIQVRRVTLMLLGVVSLHSLSSHHGRRELACLRTGTATYRMCPCSVLMVRQMILSAI
ncbi:protease pro-enzyme activation domain-containing protein [Telmatobacter bradus]|uniref:protease pro-enzyme activation domain-containing protein n=1 Tax=Telmatobacter bradus TaxID=474953 RepID=UPI003B434BC1